LASRSFGVTVDCRDPQRLARFWLLALNYVPATPDVTGSSGHGRTVGGDELGPTMIVDPEGVGPRIYFQRVPEPKAVKNRWHLDVLAGEEGIHEVLDLLLAADARMVRSSDDPDDVFIVLLDPEGNEFCLLER
jgi:hypothetical protein